MTGNFEGLGVILLEETNAENFEVYLKQSILLNLFMRQSRPFCFTFGQVYFVILGVL